MKIKAALILISTVLLFTAGSAQEWAVLFDGKQTDALRGYTQQGFPATSWMIDNGALKTVPGQAVDLITRERYENFELEYEWKVAPGGNSGVMYRVKETDGPPFETGPEMQVLDDAKHPDGKTPQTTAGALYGLIAPSPAKTLKPVGEFNQAKILVQDGRVEHWLNGARIVEYQWGSPEIEQLIARSKFKDMPGFMKESSGHIAFQHHGEEAWFRNLRIRRLPAGARGNELTEAEKAAGWKSLFDGTTSRGWRGFKKPDFPSRGWKIEDGCLTHVAHAGGGDIVTTDRFSDFELAWEWRIPARANNGVKYFVTEERASAIGHEYQMIDDVLVHEGKASTASFYDVLSPQANKPLKPVGEWNHSRVVAHGNQVEHWLNGAQVLSYEMGSDTVKEAIARSKFKTVPGFGTRLAGHILLTDHQDEASFRNIKIRELSPP